MITEFCDTHLFGRHRAGYLDTQIPATAAGQAGRREEKTAALTKRLRQIDAAEDAHGREIEAVAHLADPNAAAVVALRSRTLARFTELEAERAHITAHLDALTRQDDTPAQGPTLLDALPLLAALRDPAPGNGSQPAATPRQPSRKVSVQRPIARKSLHDHGNPVPALAASPVVTVMGTVRA